MVQDEEPVAAAVEVELVRAAGAPQRGDLALGSEPVEYLWNGRICRGVCGWHGSNLLGAGKWKPARIFSPTHRPGSLACPHAAPSTKPLIGNGATPGRDYNPKYGTTSSRH